MKALVTGANGFMGSHMVELLVKKDYEVVATDLAPYRAPPLSGMYFEYVQCDLREPEQVAKLAKTYGPFDVVFHVAALFDYGAAEAQLRLANVDGTRNLLWYLKYDQPSPPSRVVMWGAAGVYDFAKENPAKETTPVNPQGGYLKTKWEAMQFGRMYNEIGLPVTIIMPGGVYGPRSRYGVALSIMIAARGGMGPFYFGSKKNRAATVHVIDVCRAAEFLAHRPEAAGQTYNVGDDSQYTAYELTLMAARRLGFSMLPFAFPLGVMKMFVKDLEKKAAKKGRASLLNQEMLALLEFDALLDISKLKALGWQAQYPDAKKGLFETIDWYEKEGWLRRAGFKAKSAILNVVLGVFFGALVAYETRILDLDPVIHPAILALVGLQLPLLWLGRRLGFQIAYFNDLENWSRPKS